MRARACTWLGHRDGGFGLAAHCRLPLVFSAVPSMTMHDPSTAWRAWKSRMSANISAGLRFWIEERSLSCNFSAKFLREQTLHLPLLLVTSHTPSLRGSCRGTARARQDLVNSAGSPEI